MIEPLRYKIARWGHRVIRKVTGHEYDCCEKVFKRCSRCKYVKDGDTE